MSGWTIDNQIKKFCAFNEHFGPVGSLLTQNFLDEADPLQFLDNIGTTDGFNFAEVTVDYVKNVG